MRRALLPVVAAVGVLAGCGGDPPPSAEEMVRCLNAGGAKVDLDAPVSHEVGTDGFAPKLTPDTEVAARGKLGEGTTVDVFVSSGGEADRAEERAIEFLRLFGFGPDYLLRRESMLVMLSGPHDLPVRDRDLARRCLDQDA